MESISRFLSRIEMPLKIHCIGDAMVDEYYKVRVERISPEFPMPIMVSSDDVPVRKPGGIANVAHQFKYFNVETTLICLKDTFSDLVFASHGLETKKFENTEAKLPVKRRFLDGNVQIVRHDIETPKCGVSDQVIYDFHKYHRIFAANSHPHVAIFSDYNKGFFPDHFSIKDIYPDEVITIVDPKKGPLSKWRGCTVFKPNAKEAAELSGRTQWEDQAKFFRDQLDCESVVITNGGDMVCGIQSNYLFSEKLRKSVDVSSVVGAGDCFCAFFAMAMGCSFDPREAAMIAFKAGSIYVQHNMNNPVSPAELAPNGIVERPNDLCKRDFRLVFTNGCFDILHEGHVSLLNFAKKQGDKLVVAVNSDESVKRLKGEGRPIVPLKQRMAVLAGMEAVDFVVSFDEDTPLDLIAKIKPDVLVKGSQYWKNEVVGADIVKEVVLAPMIDGISTTKILAR